MSNLSGLEAQTPSLMPSLIVISLPKGLSPSGIITSMVEIGQEAVQGVVRQQMKPSKDIVVVAISGYGGSGKSTFARELSAAIPGSVILAIDDYYTPIPLPDDDWAAYDRSQLKAALERHRQNATTSLVICEGVGLFHPDSLDLFDITIWMDVNLETATAQGMKRDREEYNVDHDRLWREEWVPTERRFEAKHNPKGRAQYGVKD